MSSTLLPSLIPASGKGIVRLAAGATYDLAKTLDLRNCTLVKHGPSSAPNPIIRYAGMADSGALAVAPGSEAQVYDVDFVCAGKTYAFANEGALDAAGIRVGGGGGLCKITGAFGVTRLDRCEQTERCAHFFILAGPRIHRTAGVYAETPCGPILLSEVAAPLGSGWMGIGRFHAFTTLLARDCLWRDRAEQSSKHPDGTPAVKNAVLRVHYGTPPSEALFQRCGFDGDVSLGPLTGRDGGEDLPMGPERTCKEQQRVGSIEFDTCSFTSPVFQVAPGVLSCTLRNCGGMSKERVSLNPKASMNRPASVVRFE